ncbi:ARMD1 protein, partial [Centropus bengalensis]|nr:ARMD1 protein [Centropus bengalensis]
MASIKDQEATRNLRIFLQKWDSAHKVARGHILDHFIESNHGKTEAELELEFSQAASLFLARLTSWLRVTYTYSTCLDKLLKSIGIFLSAASGYLAEFLEIGGALILLEILGLNHLKEEDKRESVKLLQLVVDGGRENKQLICQCYGVRSLTEFLAASSSAEAQGDVQIVLDSLGRDNPEYQNEVYRGLVSVLPCASPRAQQLALQTLRALQDVVGEAPSILLEPVLGVLRSEHSEVQDEAIRMLKALMAHRLRPSLLKGLVELLTPPGEKASTSCTALCLEEPMLVYVQQAAAAKAIGTLAKESAEVAEELIQLKVVPGLAVALGNLEHAASQRHASIALACLVQLFPFVEEPVKKALGPMLFQCFMDSPETWYTEMDPDQAQEMASKIADIPREMAQMQAPEGAQG